MEAQSLGSHQHSWWFSCFSLREKLARSHNKKEAEASSIFTKDYLAIFAKYSRVRTSCAV